MKAYGAGKTIAIALGMNFKERHMKTGKLLALAMAIGNDQAGFDEAVKL